MVWEVRGTARRGSIARRGWRAGARPAPAVDGEQALASAPAITRAAYSPWPFRYLAAASICNQFAFWMQQVGLGWLVLELANSSLQLGVASFLRGVPMLLLSPISGVLVDRFDRRGLALLAHAVLTLSHSGVSGADRVALDPALARVRGRGDFRRGCDPELSRAPGPHPEPGAPR